MNCFKSTLRIILIIIIILNLAAYVFSQQKSYSEEVQIKTWKKWLKSFPLPKDAIELEVKQSFPSEGLLEKGIYLWKPIGIISLLNGNIVVNDQKFCQLFMFDDQGNFIRKIGRKGQGPSEFLNPYSLSATSEYLIVGDTKNMRLQFFDLKGNYIRSFRIFKAYTDIDISKDGLIYAAPLRTNPESPLVDVLDKSGQLLSSFGEAQFGSDKSNWWMPNRVEISLNGKDELFVAYRYFPLVCKYSKKGTLLAKYKLEHGGVMEKKEKINLDRIRDQALGMGMLPVINSIRASSDGFYILHNYPRNEILEYDSNGKLQNNYYCEVSSYDTFFKDFSVIENEGKKTFYLLKRNFENKIVILRPKKISPYQERR